MIEALLAKLRQLEELGGSRVKAELSSDGGCRLEFSDWYLTLDLFDDYKEMLSALENSSRFARYVADMKDHLSIR